MSSTARKTLEKARFFLDRAEESATNERTAFSNYLEAAIVFARSVTFHLQKEFSGQSQFEDWYSAQQRNLAANRFAKFLLKQRNYVLKQGPIETSRIIEVTMMSSVRISSFISMEIIRGAPWYKRSLRILFEDATYPIRARIHSYLQERAVKRARAAEIQSEMNPDQTRDHFYFAEAEWRSAPAIDLVRRQLNEFESIVLDAEQRFLPVSDENAT